MLENKLTRRDFIKSSGGAVIIGTLATRSVAISMLAPSNIWALELSKLDENTGKMILHITRHIFPHKTLDDAVYALVVKDLDAAASADESVYELLQNGTTELNNNAGGDWMGLDINERFSLVDAMAGSDFFEKIRSTSIVSLYNNDMAWAHFGYEGPAWPKGGYINRGFQDLDWLPEPPDAASPLKA